MNFLTIGPAFSFSFKSIGLPIIPLLNCQSLDLLTISAKRKNSSDVLYDLPFELNLLDVVVLL
jgi:hypothetical protein